MPKLKALDLFSGIGGMSRGLDKAGIETVAFCEIDPDCHQVLKKHWPNTPILRGVEGSDCFGDGLKRLYGRTIEESHTRLIADSVDLICGGYPCTGHSVAGGKKGFEDEGSKLWSEYFRLIKELKPKYCIIENSPNLRGTGLVQMLKAVNEIGYNAEWSCISAYSIGAPHQRERLYIVLWRGDLPYCNPFRWWETNLKEEKAASWWWAKRLFKRSPLFKQASKIKSRVLQFDDGVSKELLKDNEKKINMLGNSLLPQIPELIGKAIVESEKCQSLLD